MFVAIAHKLYPTLSQTTPLLILKFTFIVCAFKVQTGLLNPKSLADYATFSDNIWVDSDAN